VDAAGGDGGETIPTVAADKAEGLKIANSVISKLKVLNKWLEGIVQNWDNIAKKAGGAPGGGNSSSSNSSAPGGKSANSSAPGGGGAGGNASAAGGNATAAGGSIGSSNGTVAADNVMEEGHRARFSGGKYQIQDN
jgi:hypothetical protein